MFNPDFLAMLVRKRDSLEIKFSVADAKIQQVLGAARSRKLGFRTESVRKQLPVLSNLRSPKLTEFFESAQIPG